MMEGITDELLTPSQGLQLVKELLRRTHLDLCWRKTEEDVWTTLEGGMVVTIHLRYPLSTQVKPLEYDLIVSKDDGGKVFVISGASANSDLGHLYREACSSAWRDERFLRDELIRRFSESLGVAI